MCRPGRPAYSAATIVFFDGTKEYLAGEATPTPRSMLDGCVQRQRRVLLVIVSLCYEEMACWNIRRCSTASCAKGYWQSCLDLALDTAGLGFDLSRCAKYALKTEAQRLIETFKRSLAGARGVEMLCTSGRG